VFDDFNRFKAAFKIVVNNIFIQIFFENNLINYHH